MLLVAYVRISLDHGKEATKYLKAFLGEHYHYSDKPAFQALWHNYNVCQFVEDEGMFKFSIGPFIPEL